VTSFVRFVGLVVAWLAGLYALSCWVTGDLRQAGISAAIAGVAVVGVGLVDWLGRDRYRRGRAEVWARREAQEDSTDFSIGEPQ
jgi:hypothetical protein